MTDQEHAALLADLRRDIWVVLTKSTLPIRGGNIVCRSIDEIADDIISLLPQTTFFDTRKNSHD